MGQVCEVITALNKKPLVTSLDGKKYKNILICLLTVKQTRCSGEVVPLSFTDIRVILMSVKTEFVDVIFKYSPCKESVISSVNKLDYFNSLLNILIYHPEKQACIDKLIQFIKPEGADGYFANVKLSATELSQMLFVITIMLNNIDRHFSDIQLQAIFPELKSLLVSLLDQQIVLPIMNKMNEADFHAKLTAVKQLLPPRHSDLQPRELFPSDDKENKNKSPVKRKHSEFFQGSKKDKPESPSKRYRQ